LRPKNAESSQTGRDIRFSKNNSAGFLRINDILEKITPSWEEVSEGEIV
jgi:hypothetical protein